MPNIEELESKLAALKEETENITKQLELARAIKEAQDAKAEAERAIEEAKEKIAAADEIIKNAMNKLEPKKDKERLNFNGIQKAKSTFSQLGIAIKSRIPSSADIKAKLAEAALSVGYVVSNGIGNIENFTSDVINRISEKRTSRKEEKQKAKEESEIESIVNTEEKSSDNKLNFREGVKQKASSAKAKLGSVSKRVLDELKANTNIDLKIQETFLKADISITNAKYKVEDKVQDLKEGIRNIPSNLINKYRYHKEKIAKERQERAQRIEQLKEERESLKQNVYEMYPEEETIKMAR